MNNNIFVFVRFLILAVLLASAPSVFFPNSSFSQAPSTIPDSARVVAEGYLDEWVRRAEANPEFYGVVGKEIDQRNITLLDGYIHFTIYEPEARRFAESQATDATQFATVWMYVFPMLLNDDHVTSVLIVERSGEYVFLGISYPGGPLDRVLHGVTGGYVSGPEQPRFSVVRFMGGTGAIFVQVHSDTNDRVLVPVNHPAFEALGVTPNDDGRPVFVEQRKAATRIKTQILQSETHE